MKAMGFAAAVGLVAAWPSAATLAADETQSQSQGDTQSVGQLKASSQRYLQKIEEQERLVNEQRQAIEQLKELLKQQNQRITTLENTVGQQDGGGRVIPAVSPGAVASGTAGSQGGAMFNQAQATQPGQPPVGEAPPPPSEVERRPQVPSLPEIGGVLTPKGKLQIEPSVEYDRAATNQLTFRGVSIVEGILIGAINASDVRNDTVVGALTGRYGVTDRSEVEVKVPYVYRANTETDTVKAVSNPTTFSRSIDGHDVGDIEVAGHYQVNGGAEDWPVFVANLRYKSTTGTGPFDVGFTSTGLPKHVPTGSGFHSIQPSVTALYASDPAVFFGNVEYDVNVGTDVNKSVGGSFVSHFSPGDAIGGTIGVGVALNERASVTLGYEHFYVQSTTTTVNGIDQRANSLQVGSYLVGGTYQLTPKLGVNFQTLIGATRDAPDVRVIVRVPYTFDLL